MHECPTCGCACDCDGDDVWDDTAAARCIGHDDCAENDDDEGFPDDNAY